ncbi:hypothetical protein WDY80_24480 (plasmid) [Gordonia hongkongensis]|uniref:DUF6924 domain-containing protein n=1 Tax=Gordonia hongkongensis TaxID=1701090 RepID=UPI0030D43370
MLLAIFLPSTNEAMLVRTDFSSDDKWNELVYIASAPVDHPHPDGQFQASIRHVTVPDNAGASVEDFVEATVEGDPPFFLFIADETAVQGHEHLLLAVDLLEDRGATLRVAPNQLWSIENNLSLGNMPFRDFVQAARDGVYRGFPEV